MWRGKFPKDVKVEKPYWPDTHDGKEIWKGYDKQFLRCYEWYWKRLEKLEPIIGTTFKIDDIGFDGDEAEFNAKMIGEVLK